jgi:cytochrome P450
LPDDASVIGRLLGATDDAGEKLSREAVRNEVAVIFMAGYETMASCLSWTWYLLSQAPEVERRLVAELAEVLGGRAPTPADIPSLIYSRAVIEESLRLYPPVPLMAREVECDEKLRSREIPAGSLVVVVPWLLHRHRKHWDNPDHFMPERFLPGAPAPCQFVYVPFGVGPRVCAGMRFGLMEAVLCLATLARCFRLRLAAGTVIEPICRMTLRPEGGVPMSLEAR